MKELTTEIFQEICANFKSGAELLRAHNYKDAEVFFQRGISVLPTPQEDCEAYSWFLYGLGELHYQQGKNEIALKYFSDCLRLTEPQDINLHLRLAFTFYKLGIKSKSAEHLALAAASGNSSYSLADLEDPVFWELVDGSEPFIDPLSMPPRSIK